MKNKMHANTCTYPVLLERNSNYNSYIYPEWGRGWTNLTSFLEYYSQMYIAPELGKIQ